MFLLATERGCLACHALEAGRSATTGCRRSRRPGSDRQALRDDPAASRRLTRTVMGSSNAASRHWAGKVSEGQHAANASVVSERETRALVNWILVLVPWAAAAAVESARRIAACCSTAVAS